ncbi:tape measure protein [Elizabethkingia anophelis]|uniref:tape measure protein n=1 Tax=Elizabethkingia anophelis TaxID=1117645 RepID=UPI0016245A3F|nr:tape measure protein [Elizabethkingia anophelis]
MNGLQYVLDLMDRTFGANINRARNQTQGLDNAVKKVKSTGADAFGSLARFAKTAGAAIGIALSVSSIIGFGKEVTAVTAKFEGMTNAIEFASGQDGAKNIAFLDEKIKTLNLNMESSYKGFQTLSGSLKGTALEGQATRDIFEAVGIAATVMNLSAEQSEGAFLALSQMASKGKVQAEELRGQLGERIPGALNIAARAMGVTQAQLNDMLDKGEVYATDFLPKFAKELKATFEDGLPKAMNSMQSAINRQENALTQFKLKTGETFRPLIIGVLEAGNKLFGFLSEMMKHTEPVRIALLGVADAFKPVTDAIMNNPFLQFSTDGDMAKSVMEGIAAVIVKLTPLFAFLGEILGTIEDMYNRIRQVIADNIVQMYESGNVAQYLTNVLSVLKWIWDLIAPAIGYVGDILGAVINVVLQAIEAVLGVVNAIVEWGSKIQWIQRYLNAFVGSVQSVFKSIRDIAVNYLGGVADLIVGVFTLDIDKIKSAMQKGFNVVKETALILPRQLKGAYDGWNKELSKPVNKDVKITTINKDGKPASILAPPVGKPPKLDGSGGSGDDKDKKGKKNKVSGSGTGGDGKHMVFNIQSFVKELTIQTTNLKESPQDIRRMLADIFNDAIADIEIRANA